jgi:UDP-2,4-diacetamido-2,4,6-trideoxy-beta-L-altropyranose hydrolase
LVTEPHPSPLDLSTTRTIVNTCGGETLSWVVIDGYHFDGAYHKAVREAGCRVLVIDDMAQVSRYSADIVLNQNIHAAQMQYCADDATEFLLGPRYALLRPAFMKWRNRRRTFSETAKNLLITMGGSDPHNVTVQILGALTEFQGIETVVVLGGANPHYDDVLSASRRHTSAIQLVVDANNMEELMAWADIAIASAGSTSWELAFMGVPSLLAVLAENQRPIAEELADEGFAVNLGWYESLSESDLRGHLVRLMRDRHFRETASARGRHLVDGSGADRVVTSMNHFEKQERRHE